ncbi:MAG TPA: GNAT family N-acetyltransferase [Allosphingosinicella sp.]|jgi:CelD/BcsL family acetyltransferase involved in cellulose biosynthesis|nr:GNAT family N-acetyltransferase [Allosphingosinicella sp.]
MLNVAVDTSPAPAAGPVSAEPRSAYAVREISVRVPSDIPARLRADWQALAEAASQPNSFAEPWFVEASLASLAPKGGVRLLAVMEGDRLIGVALFAPSPRYGRVPLRHVRNWRHHNHFFGPPLIRRGEEVAFWQAILSALDEASWASGFLHVSGLVDNGSVHRALVHAAALHGRTCPVVHRARRPLLECDLPAEDYYARNVSSKRRSELARRRRRLAELGSLEVRELRTSDELEPWSSEFLALEAKGWKGKAGSAMAADPATEHFFRRAIAEAFAAGRLNFLRLDLDGRAVAMLTSFLAPPGAFGFKCTFDEDYARFSPGILLHIDNLRLLDRPGIAWIDSCANEDHPVASLWSEWRSLVRVNVRLRGVSRLLSYGGACLLEEGARLTAGLRGKTAA